MAHKLLQRKHCSRQSAVVRSKGIACALCLPRAFCFLYAPSRLACSVQGSLGVQLARRLAVLLCF